MPGLVFATVEGKRMTVMSHPVEERPFLSGSVAGARTVLIFSPDADLARTLVLNLEEKYAISRDTTLQALEADLATTRPDVILVDLFAFPEDVSRLLDVLQAKARGIPIITLRGYIPLRKETNIAIQEMSAAVFYKPVDVDLISEAIENLLRPGPSTTGFPGAQE